jgi:ATP-dependent Lhr-like helicase
MLLSFAQGLESFAVMEETYREILEDKLNLDGLVAFIEAVERDEVSVAVREAETPSPRAFGLATLMASDVVLAEDENQVLREFHERVLTALDEGANATADSPGDLD